MGNTLETVYVGEKPAIVVDSQGSGELALLLHGFAGSRKDWRLNIDSIADHFHAIAIDRRGFGDTGSYDGLYRYEDCTQDIIKVIRYFGFEKAHVVGVQAGARLAMDFAIRAPEYVDRLVIASSNSGAASMRKEDQEIVRKKFIEPFKQGKTYMDVINENGMSGFSPHCDPRAKDILMESITKVEMPSLLKFIEVQIGWDQKENLSKITAPTLLMRGVDDTLVPQEAIEEIHQAIVGSKSILVDGAGHNIHVEQPDKFNQIVLDFLRAA